MDQEVVAERVFVGFCFNNVYNTDVVTSVSSVNFFAVEILLNLTSFGAPVTVDKIAIIALIGAEILAISTNFDAAFLFFHVNETVFAGIFRFFNTN